MAQTFNSRRLRYAREIDERFLREHRELARLIGALVMAQAVSSTEPVPNLQRVRELLKASIWARILKPYYIGPGDDPFLGPDPSSPFASLLFSGVEGSIRIQAERQAALLRQIVRDDEVYHWLVGPRSLLGPTPFANTLRGWYDPFHRFVGGDGFRLSDRVWRDAIDVRSRIDRMLDYHISNGTAAVDIADELEGFLTTGSRLTKTRTPYGTKGSYAARRLARTEISAAAGRAIVNASIANPFVAGVKWTLSMSHRHVDICDEHAAGGVNGDGVYAPEAVPLYPAHPHCFCHLLPVAVGSATDLALQLRAEIRANTPYARSLRGSMNPEFLTQALLRGVEGVAA